MADEPRCSDLYFFVRLPAKLRMTSKPLSRTEPLASNNISKSCFATHTSSPLQACLLHALLWKRALFLSVGHLPRPRIGLNTFFLRFWSPPPQAMEQDDHAPHSLNVQSRSHDPVLQTRPSFVASHVSPPFLGLVRMDRVLL